MTARSYHLAKGKKGWLVRDRFVLYKTFFRFVNFSKITM
jgi:hypothetical protein